MNDQLSTLRSRITRRAFLTLAGQGAIGVSMVGCFGALGRTPIFATPDLARAVTLTGDEWLMLDAVQNHLLPSTPDSPGAREANATGYLDAALATALVPAEHKHQVKDGATALAKLSNESYSSPLHALNEQQREELLRKFEQSETGEDWLTLVMRYTLEAYLGDPAYGGNPGGVVWKWLGHLPGFPQPTTEQVVRIGRA